MIRGRHSHAGWVAAFMGYVKNRRLVMTLVLEARDPSERKQIFVFDPGHLRRAGLEEIGKGGRP